MNVNVVFRAFFHLSLNYIFLKQFTCTNGFPVIVHNMDCLKRGVLRRVLKCPYHPENSEQQQAVELVAASLVSDTSTQGSLVEVQNLWAEKMSDPGNVV